MIVHDCPPVYPAYRRKSWFGIVPDLGIPWRKIRLMYTLIGYFTRCTVAVSRASRDVLVNLHKFPSWKVKINYHGADINLNIPSAEQRRNIRRKLNIPDSDIVIVSTAMFYPVKRVDRLVEAFGVLARDKDNVRLLLVGAGSEYTRIIGIVNTFETDIIKRINFLGFQENIPDFLQASEIYVLSSDSEGLPLACLEAMSCGLINVVTDCGGTSEIIKDGWNGFLTEKSVQGILGGLNQAINLSIKEKAQVSNNARKTIESKFDLQKNVICGLKALQITGEDRSRVCHENKSR